MDEMTHRDSSLDAQQQPALDPGPKQHTASVPRSVILSIGVFVLCFAVLFAAPVLALRLRVSPADAVAAVGGPEWQQPDVRASAVVTTVVLQEGKVPFINGYPSGSDYSGTKDTYINQWEPTKNFANETRLVLGQSGAYRPLIYFDMGPASIPSNATIVDAQLGIYCNARNQFNSMGVEAYQVNRHWQLWQASWNKASSTENWTLEGCNHVALDREGTPLTSTVVFDREAFHDFEITAAVQDWVSTPASNEGILLTGPGPNVIYYYRNSRYSTVDERPRLVITWTIGAPTPTPTATPTSSPTPGCLLYTSPSPRD